MKKFYVLLFGIGLLGTSQYGLTNHSYYIQLLINLSRPYMFIRLTLVMVLVVYVFIPQIRLYFTKTLLGIGGIILLFLGLISLGSPNLLGYTGSYILIGDSFTLIEGGILAIVLSAELVARRTMYISKSFHYIELLLSTQLTKIMYFHLHHARKLKTQS